MKPVLLTLSLLLILPSLALAHSDMFTVYLVRHAEKQSESNDPPLTECGKQRAESLARLLSSVKLEHVYSSDYKRTLNTAAPVAKTQNLEVELYDPGHLQQIKTTLLDDQQDALVVGHGNTTAVLAGMLATEALEETEYSSYDRIYQVVISDNSGRVHLLHDLFQCSE
jgi:broad specificity phosphatase PhoE